VSEDDPKSNPSAQIPSWLVPPEQNGIKLQLNLVADQAKLTPEVLRALQHAMEELQRVPGGGLNAGCPHLLICGDNNADCPFLVSCGTNKPAPPPPCPTQLIQPGCPTQIK
jgi:hypothetical protein